MFAGNHRVAILGLDREIPCCLDKLVYLKRDKEIISKRFFGIGQERFTKNILN